MTTQQPEAQQATCTNSDSWNCKYCNKTKTCAALAAGQATAAPAQPAAQQPHRSGCTAGTDEECVQRGCGTNCPAGSPRQGVAYAALPTSSHAGRVYEEGFLIGTCPLYTADQLRAFADATCALRASHGQAPAAPKGDTDE